MGKYKYKVGDIITWKVYPEVTARIIKRRNGFYHYEFLTHYDSELPKPMKYRQWLIEPSTYKVRIDCSKLWKEINA